MTRFLLPLILIAASPLAARTLKQQQGPATLEIEFPGATQSLALADLLVVTLTVEGHETLRVQAPTELAAREPWDLVERTQPERIPIGAERVRWQIRYRFAPRAPGKKVAFAFPEVALREKDEAVRSVPFDAIDCEVTTSIPSADAAEPRGITGIETSPVIADVGSARPWCAWAGFLLALLTLAGVVRWVLRRRRCRSSAQIALYEWQRLTALKLAEQNRSERFVTLLTLLVRRYLEREFGIPARRQTTQEFLQQVGEHAAITSDEKQLLTEFLHSTEAVKFANQTMSLQDCQRWSEAVRRFLQRRLKLVNRPSRARSAAE